MSWHLTPGPWHIDRGIGKWIIQSSCCVTSTSSLNDQIRFSQKCIFLLPPVSALTSFILVFSLCFFFFVSSPSMNRRKIPRVTSWSWREHRRGSWTGVLIHNGSIIIFNSFLFFYRSFHSVNEPRIKSGELIPTCIINLIKNQNSPQVPLEGTPVLPVVCVPQFENRLFL